MAHFGTTVSGETGNRKDTSFCYIASLATTPYTTTKKFIARGGCKQHANAPGGAQVLSAALLSGSSVLQTAAIAPMVRVPTATRPWCAVRVREGKAGVFLVRNRPICKEHP